MSNKLCPNCGHGHFRATQRCTGSVGVVCTLPADSAPIFLRNMTENGQIDPNELEWDNPTGPFTCLQCEQELK